MPVLAALLASVAYLVPLVIVQLARGARPRARWQAALGIPLTVSIDLLTILTLSRVVTLEKAVLLSRLLWLLGAVTYFATRGTLRRLKWPPLPPIRECAAIGLAVGLVVVVSASVSMRCLIHDRALHIPLVTALRGQQIPFANVYHPAEPLWYHYAGDAHAAALQVLSLGVLHSSAALALSHTILLALFAATLALLLSWLGHQNAALTALGPLGVLLAGPFTLHASDIGSRSSGYNFPCFLSLSYRPHTALAGLLLVGFVGSLLVRMRDAERAPPLLQTASPLVACTALLAVTDEASIGILGITLGATWFLFPAVIAPRRVCGAVVLAALLGSVLVPIVLFGGPLASGAPAHEVWPVPWRSPGFYRPALPLSTPGATGALLRDVLPAGLLCLAGGMSLVRRRERGHVSSVCFFALHFALSVAALTGFDVDFRPVESHRFMTGTGLLLPVAGLTWIADTRVGSRLRFALRPATLLTVLALGLSALSTAQWLRVAHTDLCRQTREAGLGRELLAVNCRSELQATLGEPPAHTYLSRDVAYLYAGCRPVFTAGTPGSGWGSRVGAIQSGRPAFVALHERALALNQPVRVICRKSPSPPRDAACDPTSRSGNCIDLGSDVESCSLGAPDRERVLERWPR